VIEVGTENDRGLPCGDRLAHHCLLLVGAGIDIEAIMRPAGCSRATAR
jgi:hypothetical protein